MYFTEYVTGQIYRKVLSDWQSGGNTSLKLSNLQLNIEKSPPIITELKKPRFLQHNFLKGQVYNVRFELRGCKGVYDEI